jgi:WD40 repeat protein
MNQPDIGAAMSEQSFEQFGGVLAAPRRPWRLLIASAVLALALAAGAAVVINRIVQGSASLMVTLNDPGGHGATSAAFSPDGKTLAILDADGTTYLWDIPAGSWITTLSSPECQGGDAEVLFSPDGTTLAVVGASNGDSCLWNVATRRQVAVLTDPSYGSDGPSVTSGAFSPDGKTLAIGDSDGCTYLWDVADARQITCLADPSDSQGAPGDVEAVAFSPDGTRLAAGDGNENTYIWDLATRKVVATLNDATDVLPSGAGYDDYGGVESLAFCADGTLAVGDGDGNVFVWNAATGQPVITLAPPINIMEANSLYYSPGDVAGQIENGNGPIGVTLASSKNGSLLATGIDYGYGADLWSGTGTAVHQTATLTDPHGDNSQAPQVALSPDGTMLAVVDHNGRTYLWHIG